MHSRRAFLRLTGALGSTALAAETVGLDAIHAATAAIAERTPEEVAADESYWRDIQSAFTLDRSMINLNNGNSCPSPTVVHEAYKRYLDYSNMTPVYHRTLIEQNLETARRRLANEFGCDIEEMAITRNSSEALQIAQNGIDLRPGDEVLTTEQDYPRMLTTWDQRARRDEIVIKRINFPVPTTDDDLFERLTKAITPKTKVLHFCHITNLTGQLFPVQRLSRYARERGILTIVDGAHAVAHFPFKLRDLECDYYGTSLHKWLLAPTGTGFLYVRQDRIANTWPMQAAPSRRDNDIRKFEEIGTHPAGARAAINEAVEFHRAIGAERKAARFHYLTMRWANRLKSDPRIQIHSDLAPGRVWGVACVGIKGMDTAKISAFMWDKYRIVVNGVGREDTNNPQFTYSGLRVTPNIYTQLDEIDTFADGMEELLKKGLPGASA
jgi:selenocysteine lyase/cysteine desulfurase